jgi:hypothetical protein
MRNNAVLIRDGSLVDDGWSGAEVGHFPQPRLGMLTFGHISDTPPLVHA